MNKIATLCLLALLSLPCFAAPKLPVSELHVHAEAGIMTPDNIDYLAKKHHLKLSSKDFVRDGIIYHKPGDFMDFLNVYDKVTALIKDHDDLTYVIYDYLRRAHDDGAIYEELTTSPMHFPQMSYAEVINAVANGIDKAHRDFGIDARILVVMLRHKGPAACERTLDKMLAYPHPYVVGISLAGDDVHFPASQFRRLYARAKAAGLKLSAHMGEHTSSADIRTALAMKLDRVGHGVSVVKDKALMQEVAAKHIGFEVCPSSNVDGGKGIFRTFQEHPLHTMLKHHLFVSINTDDPGFLHTSIGKEYRLVQQAYGLSHSQMIQLCRNAVSMSFAGDALKKRLLAKIDDYERIDGSDAVITAAK